jgi:3-hydroxyethyl bacteriochlorophyllide a dehydrogenase
MGPEGALLALAATARHAIAGINTTLPDLIVGHGVFGRLLARLTIAAGGKLRRRCGKSIPTAERGEGYEVVHPDDDERRDYARSTTPPVCRAFSTR